MSGYPGPVGATVSGPIVLVGLSGAGKTEVGARLAAALGWDLFDVDAEVERAAGCSIAAIFDTRGEDGFRDLEARVTRAASPGPRTVVATGGGWMARPALRDVWPGTVRVWLRVSPAIAIERLANESLTRPLLAGPEPEAVLAGLLVEREPAYALAEYAVETDGRTVEQVAEAILAKVSE